MSYKTPGVYVEEISLLPPSVAQVETAIPAFIGYTAIAEDSGEDLTEVPTRITSLLEYETYFGKGNNQDITVILSNDEPFTPLSVKFKDDNESPYRMYPAMQLYFANGGGPCYIVSVGDYSALDNVEDYDELKAAGVSAVFGPGTNIPAAAGEVLSLIRQRRMAA